MDLQPLTIQKPHPNRSLNKQAKETPPRKPKTVTMIIRSLTFASFALALAVRASAAQVAAKQEGVRYSRRRIVLDDPSQKLSDVESHIHDKAKKLMEGRYSSTGSSEAGGSTITVSNFQQEAKDAEKITYMGKSVDLHSTFDFENGGSRRDLQNGGTDATELFEQVCTIGEETAAERATSFPRFSAEPQECQCGETSDGESFFSFCGQNNPVCLEFQSRPSRALVVVDDILFVRVDGSFATSVRCFTYSNDDPSFPGQRICEFFVIGGSSCLVTVNDEDCNSCTTCEGANFRLQASCAGTPGTSTWPSTFVSVCEGQVSAFGTPWEYGLSTTQLCDRRNARPTPMPITPVAQPAPSPTPGFGSPPEPFNPPPSAGVGSSPVTPPVSIFRENSASIRLFFSAAPVAVTMLSLLFVLY